MKIFHGYTLLEILIALVLVSILLIIAIPSWHNIRNRYKTEIDVNCVVGTLQYARNSAIHLQIPVRICPSDDGYSCVQAKIFSWTCGWLVYLVPSNIAENYFASEQNESENVNINHSSDLNISTLTTSILRAYPSLTNGELIWHGLDQHNEIQFNADGSAVGYNGRFDYCPNNENADECKSIVLSPTGRARVTTNSMQLQ